MADEKRDMLYSTDDIWLGEQSNRCLTDVVDDMYSKVDFFPDNYAAKEHSHSEYAIKNHNHNTSYYKKSEVDEMLTNLKNEFIKMIDDISVENNISTVDSDDATADNAADVADNTDSSSE